MKSFRNGWIKSRCCLSIVVPTLYDHRRYRYSKPKKVDLVLYMVKGGHRLSSLQDDVRGLLATGLLPRTVYVVARGSIWPKHINNNEIVRFFHQEIQTEQRCEFCIRHQEPREDGKMIDDIWAEIYKAACGRHAQKGCLGSSCAGYMKLLPKSVYKPL